MARVPGRRGGGGHTVEPVVQSILHAQHPGRGTGQKHQQQRGRDPWVSDGRAIAHDR